MSFVLRKGSGRVLRPCHFLMLPAFKPVWTIQAFNLSNEGIRLSAQCVPYLPCYAGFLILAVHITFQTVIMKTLQNLTYNVVHVLDISGRGIVLRSSNIIISEHECVYG
ncbi:MAG: hypothetical protein H6Q92_1315 [Nitrospirae bacterium]|nr:hypothetical protein [Nitrospirota bacterium]